MSLRFVVQEDEFANWELYDRSSSTVIRRNVHPAPLQEAADKMNGALGCTTGTAGRVVFPAVVNPLHRRYILRYWRFLLGVKG